MDIFRMRNLWVNETNLVSVYRSGIRLIISTPDYNFYFGRITHKCGSMCKLAAVYLRNRIIGVQACFGSTGDQIAYKGNVAKQYQITDAQFDSLFEGFIRPIITTNTKTHTPKITMLSNPDCRIQGQQY